MKNLIGLYRDLLGVLPADAKRFFIRYASSLALLSVLDAASLALLAVIITPLVTGTSVVLPIVGEVEGAGLIAMIVVVCLLVILKGVFAVGLLWWATRRFARFELETGSRLFNAYIEAPWVERLSKNSIDLVRIVDSSVGATIAGVLLPGASLLGEAFSFAVVIIVLAIAQPLVAITAFAYLGVVAAVLSFWITRRARQAGRVNLTYTLRSSRLITEMVGALKEVTLRNKSAEVAEVVRENRVHTSRARANYQFLSQVPRYVLEASIIGGFVLVGAVGWFSGGAAEALTAVALFSLAGFRMAPSLVRFQSIISNVTNNTPHARRVIDEITAAENANRERLARPTAALPAEPKVLKLENVSFRYTEHAEPAVRSVDLEIPFGQTVAFVGSSGAGKSTLIDLLLGLIDPTEGAITVDGIPLTSLTTAWRSHVAYVPQEVSLFDSSVAQNVALTWRDDFDRDRVRDALDQAELLATIDARPDGIDGAVGERGLALSGGQRQRIGIARALYPDPSVLIMDEATSALDTATEAAITQRLKKLHGSMTIVMVAHRLATVMHADQIFYLRDGQVIGRGTFDELVRNVPEFAHQAALAGLVEPGSTARRGAATSGDEGA